MLIVLAILILIILMIFASCVKIVPQATALVIERLGAYQWQPGKWESTLKCRSLTVWQEK